MSHPENRVPDDPHPRAGDVEPGNTEDCDQAPDVSSLEGHDADVHAPDASAYEPVEAIMEPAYAGTPPVEPPPSSVAGALDEVLRRPDAIAQRTDLQLGWAGTWRLLVGAVVCFAFYGLAAGAFSGGHQLLVAAGKAPLILLASLLLCLPSLYVVSALVGASVSWRWLAHMMAAFAALIGLLLLGLVPVAWLFSISSRYLGFVVILHGLAWLVCLGFGGRFLVTAVRSRGGGDGLAAWVLLFALVSFQITTQLRPVLTPAPVDDGPAKQFFLEHFARSLEHSQPQ